MDDLIVLMLYAAVELLNSVVDFVDMEKLSKDDAANERFSEALADYTAVCIEINKERS